MEQSLKRVPYPFVFQNYNSNISCVNKFDKNKKIYQIFIFLIVITRIIYNDITKENMSLKESRRQVLRV